MGPVRHGCDRTVQGPYCSGALRYNWGPSVWSSCEKRRTAMTQNLLPHGASCEQCTTLDYRGESRLLCTPCSALYLTTSATEMQSDIEHAQQLNGRSRAYVHTAGRDCGFEFW